MSGYRSELGVLALIFGIAALSALITVAVSARARSSYAPLPTPVPTARPLTPTPVPSMVAGPLDGLPVSRRTAERRPVAVVVDNFYPDARPQSGILKASVVFEAPTEGGITRLLALYLEHDPGQVGPVRSARSYFVAWAAGFGAIFVHAGGAPSALTLLHRTPSVVDVEALGTGDAFTRMSGRSAPHDLYANVVRIRSATSAGRASMPVAPLLFRAPLALHARGRTTSFSVSFATPQVSSSPAYNVTYNYVRTANVYLRSQNGMPFVDRTGGGQAEASNVVVMDAPESLILNDPLGRIAIPTSGSGTITVFQNGRVVHGHWSKSSVTDPIRFTGGDGTPIAFVPGHTWIEVVPAGGLTIGAAP